jgi:hypothetical protein
LVKKRKEEGAPEEKKEIKSRPSQPISRAPHDPLAVRTIIVTGLPQPLDSKTLWKKNAQEQKDSPGLSKKITAKKVQVLISYRILFMCPKKNNGAT